MPSDTAKLICIFCGHKQTVRLGAGLWWRCKGKPGQTCEKRNPGPTIVGDILRSVIGKHQVAGDDAKKKAAAGAGGNGRATGPTSSKPVAPAPAGTTVGRRRPAAPVAQTPKEQPLSKRKVDGSSDGRGEPRRGSATTSETNGSSRGAKTPSTSRGRSLLNFARELVS